MNMTQVFDLKYVLGHPTHIIDILEHDHSLQRSYVEYIPKTLRQRIFHYLVGMLVNQGYHTTLRYISEHPDTLPSTINILASSHKQIHNIYAAKSPNISVEYLEKLSYHGDQWVRRNVIMNQKCPDEILNRLSHDKNDNVRVLASSTLNKRICAHT